MGVDFAPHKFHLFFGLIWHFRDHLEAFWTMFELSSLFAFFVNFLDEKDQKWLDMTIGDNLQAF